MSSEGSPPYKAKADLVCQIDSRSDSVNSNDKRAIAANAGNRVPPSMFEAIEDRVTGGERGQRR